MKTAMKTVTFSLGLLLSAGVNGQWVLSPDASIPRTKDGKPNLAAPAPKGPDGKPDFSGVWVTKAGYTGNIAKDLKPGEVQMQPWAEQLYKHRADTLSKDDPQAYCVLSGMPREHVVPYPFKILHSKGVIVFLYEALHSYRQIFLDGRQLPKDPNPSWMGYSVGRWEGDTLVVESSGFVENEWLDNSGHPGTEQMRMTERMRRRDFGHIDLSLTIDDPKAYKKPWTVNLEFTLMPDQDLIEYVCSENEKDMPHLVGK